MKKTVISRYSLTNLLLILIVVLSLVVGENVDFFRAYDTKLSISTAVCVGLVLLAFCGVFIASNLVKNKGKINYFVFAFLSIFFIIACIGIWTCSEHTLTYEGKSAIFAPSTKQNWIYTIEIFITYLVMVSLLVIYPSRKVHVRGPLLVAMGIIIFGLSAVIYSLVAEFESYKAIFEGTAKEFNVSIKSFFNNENVYGFMCMVSIFACAVLSFYKGRIYHFILMAIFFIAMFFSTCFTSLLVSGFFILCYFIFRIIISFKNHAKRNSIILSILFLLAFLGSIVFKVLYKSGIPFAVNIVKFIREFITNKDTSTFTGRVEIWKDLLSLLNPKEWVIGCGYKNFNDLFDTLSVLKHRPAMHSAESAYVQIIGSYGILGLTFYAAYMGFIIYICIYLLTKKKVEKTLPILFAMISVLIYSYVENCTLIECNMKSMAIVALFLPTLFSEYNLYGEKIKIEKSEKLTRFKTAININKFLSKFLLILTFVLASSFTMQKVRDNKDIFIFMLIISFSSFLMLPTVISTLHLEKRKWKNSLFLKYVLNLGVIFTVPAIVAIVIAYKRNAQLALLASGISYFVILFSFALIRGYKFYKFLPCLKIFIDVLKESIIPMSILGACYIFLGFVTDLTITKYGLSFMINLFLLLGELGLSIYFFRFSANPTRFYRSNNKNLNYINNLML